MWNRDGMDERCFTGEKEDDAVECGDEQLIFFLSLRSNLMILDICAESGDEEREERFYEI